MSACSSCVPKHLPLVTNLRINATVGYTSYFPGHPAAQPTYMTLHAIT